MTIGKLVFISSIWILSGCASMSGYKPIVDAGAGYAKDASTTSNDFVECEELARSGMWSSTLVSGLMGGALGSGAGAGVGAYLAGTGIASGAMFGAGLMIPFAGYEAFVADEAFEIGYRTCLRNRGHSVIK